ncbi:hypothetical protein [Micromonospora sp. NPDC002717]|uniref:hypothetical protein n=1 Tax=Micromonospora sp. NPDC002717 TaxID=3154424 RepID=UPI003326C28E
MTTMLDDVGGRRAVACLRTRLLPVLPAARAVAVHQVVSGDRLDLLSHRHLGDPLAFWQIADANAALDPDELVAPGAEGRLLVIPMPGM